MVQSERFAKKVQQWSCAGRKGPLAKGTPGHGVDWCGNGDRPLFGVGTVKEPRSKVGDVEKEARGEGAQRGTESMFHDGNYMGRAVFKREGGSEGAAGRKRASCD